jgi:aryl-alcohol dehydrogenase-like predicted oxidoreductase
VERLGERDWRHNLPRFGSENLKINSDRFAPLRHLAEAWEITPGQLSLAWLLHQSPSVVPIPGSRSPRHIDENNAAAKIVLTSEQLAMIDEAAADFQPVGATLWDVPNPT